MNTLRYTVQIMNNQQKEDAATLEILQTIENQNDVTQRHLADKLDVALGLANSYLKRCVRKGLIKVQQAPANRYLYYLTPKGISEKSRLTADYLSSSFSFYRNAGDSLTDIYETCRDRHWERILFCGVSELAEIASVRAMEHQMIHVGTWDPNQNNQQFLKKPVWNSLLDVDAYDACLLTALNQPSEIYELLCSEVDRHKVLIPSILGMNIES